MTRRRLPLLLSLAALTLFGAGRTGPARAELSQAEQKTDISIQQRWSEDPLVLIGGSRAFYVEGFGVVITAEVNLVTGPKLTPFNQTISPETMARHRTHKLERLSQLRDLLSTDLQQAKTWFPELKDDDHIALGVQMFRYKWEDASGMPSQILMQTVKRKDAPIQVQEN
jgi:hypothetical protein